MGARQIVREQWRGWATLAFVLLWALDPFASLTPDGQIEPERVLYFPLAYGLIVGRWWAVAAALLPVLGVALSGDGGGGVALFYLAPWLGLCIALGVAVHQGISWLWRRTRPERPAVRTGGRS